MIIPLDKLAKLAPKHRMRKAALVLGDVERQLLFRNEIIENGELSRWASGLSDLFLGEKDSPQALRSAAVTLRTIAETGLPGADLIRAIDTLRHALFAATGQAPADWDLIDPTTGLPDPRTRRVFPGIKVFLEDLRSPFNVGSIFRTADAFGVEELILSPSCADPSHPRAQRSAMGAIELVSWRRATLDGSIDGLPVFGLELGGRPIRDFSFPDKGLVLLGSEELGLSREARDRCTLGTVSIPMSGAKGSLNVAVAFGILMYAWIESLGKL